MSPEIASLSVLVLLTYSLLPTFPNSFLQQLPSIETYEKELLPSLLTMAVVTPATVILLFESNFSLAATRIMVIFCPCHPMTRSRINVETAKLFATGEAPGTTTSGPHHESPLSLKTTGKNVITGIIFETPAFTPRTLFRITGHPIQ